ncbi:MAG TPA: HD domain-containing protein [Acidimicrobiia bacterium]|nr:HD domain-containing protein [Acidimicrobiia bacterium]
MSDAGIDEIFSLFERWGANTYDEAIPQVDHALQTAALAVRDGAPDEVVAAALLHDVGHLLDLDAGRDASAGDLRHEDTGAAWLRQFFPAAVAAPVALHVRAKRYLCAVDPAYARGLSAGSVRSLARQGGPMSPQEASSFARLPGSEHAIALRRWDDAGKVDGLDVPPLDAYTELLARVRS